MLVVRADDPKFSIVDANDAYLQLGEISLNSIAGLGVFEVFPVNPADSKSTGPSAAHPSFGGAHRTVLAILRQ
jgi:hypothetical protein